MSITAEERAAWEKLVENATSIAQIVPGDDETYDAMYDDYGFEYSCAVFDNHADALLFASAAPIIRRLLAENAELQARNHPQDASEYSSANELTDVGLTYREVDALLHPGDWG